MGLVFVVFLVSLFVDWRSGVYVFSIAQHYVLPGLTLLVPLLCVLVLAGHGQEQFVYGENPNAKLGLYVWWFVLAIVFELALSGGPNVAPVGVQASAYLSFAQVILWALAGYQFVQRREDARWVLHRFAVGIACICALSYLPVLAGQSEVAVATQSEAVNLSAVGTSAYLPNWGAQGFLLFGYCWFLSQVLAKRRLFSLSTAGLLACCELWAQLTKSTIFAIVPSTLAILVLMALRARNLGRLLRAMAIVFGLAAGGLMIANAQSHGELMNRALGFAAARFFHVRQLDRLDVSLSTIITVGSSGRLQVVWPEAIQRFKMRPVFGGGFNQEFGPGLPIHSGYLDVLTGVGLAGALPVLLGFLWWFRTVWKAGRLPENVPVLVPCLGYAICFCAVNAGDLLRYFYTPMMFFGLVLGISMKVSLLRPEGGGGQPKARLGSASV